MKGGLIFQCHLGMTKMKEMVLKENVESFR